MVNKLQIGNPHRRELQGHPPDNGTDSDDAGLARCESFSRNDIVQPAVTFLKMPGIHQKITSLSSSQGL
ncbi:MAG: hypothetical protein GY845_31365 [Planctomycetes bacterium]|nr:hypothetical protein [Planctomycetota bacterium]